MEIAAPLPMTVDDAIADVAARFLTHLPPAETATVERLFAHIQQAHWYYEDFLVDQSNGALPHLSSWDFSAMVFDRCPMLLPYRDRSAEFLAAFKAHMNTVPVFGAILLTADMRHVLLIRSFGGKTWNFPRGKVNEGETGIQCAVREVWEETGYDCGHLLDPSRAITHAGDKTVTLYIAVGVPNDGSVSFAPQTRKEVSEIGWFECGGLFACQHDKAARSKFWNTTPFLPQLQRWIAAAAKGKAAGGGKAGKAPKVTAAGEATSPTPATPKPASHRAKPAPTSGGAGARSGSAGGVAAADGGGGAFDVNAPLEEGGPGHAGGWSVQDMWNTNAKLLGKAFVYDGNPHTFGDAAVMAVPTTLARPVSSDKSGKKRPTPGPPVITPLPRAATNGKGGPTPAPPPPPATGAKVKPTTSRAGKPFSAGAAGAAGGAHGLGEPPAPANAGIAEGEAFRFDMDAIWAAMGWSAPPPAPAAEVVVTPPSWTGTPIMPPASAAEMAR